SGWLSARETRRACSGLGARCREAGNGHCGKGPELAGTPRTASGPGAADPLEAAAGAARLHAAPRPLSHHRRGVGDRAPVRLRPGNADRETAPTVRSVKRVVAPTGFGSQASFIEIPFEGLALAAYPKRL